MADIQFFNEEVSFRLQGSRNTGKWIAAVIKKEGHKLRHLNFIFCSDEHLYSINQTYLNHNTFTDIITFDNSEMDGSLEGDIFISIDRVRANAAEFQKPFKEELHRVLIHGVLHLLGYSDKTSRQKSTMRKKEDAYLSLRNKFESARSRSST
jgi:rRNA maturation RNase YbeY